MLEIISLIVVTVEVSHGILKILHSLTSVREEIKSSIQEANLVGMCLTQLIEILMRPGTSYSPQVLSCALETALDCHDTCVKLKSIADTMVESRRRRVGMPKKLHRIQAELEHQKSMFHLIVAMVSLVRDSPGIRTDIHDDRVAEQASADINILIRQAEDKGSRRLDAEADDDEPMEGSGPNSISGSILGSSPEVSEPEDDIRLITLPAARSSPHLPSQISALALRDDAILRNHDQESIAGRPLAPTRAECMQALVSFLAAVWREPPVGISLYNAFSFADSEFMLGNQTQPQPAGVNTHHSQLFR
ncbi:hypothetical protein BO71DRAFT_441279 [Aspergillus ellipticus CBS 707.79]|uniref:Uncharacterized protein n=1 Tax=Aspergillus ellipticus CBS 707.79 TaxID=1448320 RepID=A0A319D9J7_9EURO|nr:hypothetical protein BO71DRAFT_441279 [Aspergillus ellipticus CBS 707.79]